MAVVGVVAVTGIVVIPVQLAVLFSLDLCY